MEALRHLPGLPGLFVACLFSGALRYGFPAYTRRWPNVGLLLGQRRRRWANSKPTLGQRLMFAGLHVTEKNQRVHYTLYIKNITYVKNVILVNNLL